MAEFNLTINCDNSAFDDALGPEIEVARILKLLAERIHYQDFAGDSAKLQDINGNTVGSFYFSS